MRTALFRVRWNHSKAAALKDRPHCFRACWHDSECCSPPTESTEAAGAKEGALCPVKHCLLVKSLKLQQFSFFFFFGKFYLLLTMVANQTKHTNLLLHKWAAERQQQWMSHIDGLTFSSSHIRKIKLSKVKMGTICFIWTNRSKISLPCVINTKYISETVSIFSVTLGLQPRCDFALGVHLHQDGHIPSFNSHEWWVATTEHRSTEQGWQHCKSSPKPLTKSLMTYVSEEKGTEGGNTILQYHWRTNCCLPRYFLFYSFIKTIKIIIIKPIYPSSMDSQKQECP